MKITPLLLAVTSGVALAKAPVYTNSIVETHYNSNPLIAPTLKYHTAIENASSAKGKKGVIHETVYELFATNVADITEEHLLDTKTVFTKGPGATLNITTIGPYTTIPRTRADQPFSLIYTISNLLPESATNDTRYTSTILNSEILNTDGSVKSGKFEKIVGNQSNVAVVKSPQSIIGFSNPETVEPVTLNFTLNENVATDADELASQKVQIWPKHSGSLSGVIDKKRYSTIPTINYEIKNLYPGGTARLQVYKKSDGPSASKEITSYPAPENTPGSKEVIVNIAPEIFDSPGVWVIRLIASTVYGEEEVARVEPNYQPVLNIRANVNSSE